KRIRISVPRQNPFDSLITICALVYQHLFCEVYQSLCSSSTAAWRVDDVKLQRHCDLKCMSRTPTSYDAQHCEKIGKRMASCLEMSSSKHANPLVTLDCVLHSESTFRRFDMQTEKHKGSVWCKLISVGNLSRKKQLLQVKSLISLPERGTKTHYAWIILTLSYPPMGTSTGFGEQVALGSRLHGADVVPIHLCF
ncbi:hypothetical protein HYC85_000371, partial [Camellia sinensis]